jgi:hypothetical protein
VLSAGQGMSGRGIILSDEEVKAIIGAMLTWRTVAQEMSEVFTGYGKKNRAARQGATSMIQAADEVLAILDWRGDASV